MAFAVDAQGTTGLPDIIDLRRRVASHSRNLALLSLLLIAGVIALAQGVSGRIVGTLSDSSGAVIPNARVTITNQGTGIVTRVMSNSSGEYPRTICLRAITR